jgi:O-antigen ligase
MLWILIGYMWLFIHRPFEVWPTLGDLHFERFYMLGAMAYALVYPNKRWLPNPQHSAYFAFAAAVAVCWLASPWADKAEEVVENYFKILVFYVLLVTAVHDEKSLKKVVLAFLVIMTVYMLHSLREYMAGRHTYRMGFARMIGVDKTLGDPNSFAAGITYALPFVVPFWRCRPSQTLRLFLCGYVALSVLCLVLTGSRGSFIALALWFGIVVLKSRWRWALILGGVVAVPVLWGVMPHDLQTRFTTIIDPSVGPKNAQESGETRWEGFNIGLELFSRNPITGCGPGAWRPATRRNIESHNMYGQLLGEMGSLGLVTFSAILLCFWWNLRGMERAYRRHPEWGQDFLYLLARAIGMSLFLLLFEGNFGHNLLRFSWLWYGGFLIIARYCVQQRSQRSGTRLLLKRTLFVVPPSGGLVPKTA